MECTSKMTPEVKELLQKQPTWTLATMGETPNAVPVFFTHVTDCGMLVIGDVFMNQTLKNLANCNKVAISAYEGLTGYQLKGTAMVQTEGEAFDGMSAAVASKGMKCKGVVLVNVEEIVVTSPGPNVGKAL